MQERAYSFRFTPTHEDVAALVAYSLEHSPDKRTTLRRLYGYGLLLFLVFAWFAKDHPRWGVHNLPGYAAYLAVTFALGSVLYYAYLTWVRTFLFQRLVGRASYRDLCIPTHLTLTPERIWVETSQGRGGTSWSSIQEIGTDERGLYLLTTPLRGFVVPRSVFTSEAALRECAETLRAWHAAARKDTEETHPASG